MKNNNFGMFVISIIAGIGLLASDYTLIAGISLVVVAFIYLLSWAKNK